MGRGVQPGSPFYGRLLVTALRRRTDSALENVAGVVGSASMLSGLEAPTHAGPSAPPSTPQATPDSYLSQVAKYIPAEIVAAWLFLSTILKVGNNPSSLTWIVFGCLAVLTPIYLWRTTKQSTRKLRVAHSIEGTVAFGIWAFALGGPFVTLSWYSPSVAVVALVLYSLAVPLVIDPGASPQPGQS